MEENNRLNPNQEFENTDDAILEDISQESKNTGFTINDSFLDAEESNTVAEEISDVLPLKKEKRKKKGKKSVVKTVIKITVVVLLIFSIAFAGIYAAADFFGLGFGRGEECEIQIPQGSSLDEITDMLYDAGAVKIPFLFKAYCKLEGIDSQLKYGYYRFNTESGYKTIANMLITQGAKAEVIRVTIPEGTGINDYTKNVNGEKVTVPGIATILENKGVCLKSDFIESISSLELDSRLLKCANKGKTYYTLEGYLFPETYEFYKLEDSKKSAQYVVEKLVKEADRRITDEMYEKAEKKGLSMNEVLTLASIVQMEAGNKTAEMPNVAAVFLNRLKSPNFKTLGSSPTCYYGDSFKYDDGRYNTYNVEGLPPGPLCSPGMDAINAVLDAPTNSPYYYFVTDATGKFYFHKTLAEQNITIESLKQGNNWIYEYFD